MSDRSRRDALKIAAATLPVLPVLNAQEGHQHHAQPAAAKAQPKKSYAPKALTSDEFETLAQLVDLIIPRTETPGARDAGVHISIDKQCAASSRFNTEVRDGLAGLNATSMKRHDLPFARLTEARQVAILKPMSDSGDAFFRAVKSATIDAYYTSKEGLTQELEWNANTYVAEFKGCTHKEHQS